jgi:mannose-6-phosphate isomerase-like protein (cupin superfamily)
MSRNAINLGQKFALFDERWSPKVIAEMNDYQFKIVKLQGDFVWHHHADTDETFIVIDGDSGSIFTTAPCTCRPERCT